MEKLDNACILACETLRPELELVMTARMMDIPVFYVESGKHVFPDKLRESIQEKLDEIPEDFATVLFVFGFCGNAMVGVRSGAHTLVLPKAADCIPIFIGSQDERNAYGARRYFFTEGYLESESNVAADHSGLVEKYGEENARMITQEMLKHYENISVIDTGAFDTARVASALEELSEITGIPIDILPGNLRIIEMLLSGDWPESEFFVFAPGSEVTLQDAMSFQSISQIG
jgi:hypothetical protein